MSTFGCPHCGKPNPLNTTFCAHCGTDLRDLFLDWLAEDETAEEPSEEISTEETAQAPTEGDLLADQPWLRPDADASPEEEAVPEDQPWLAPTEEEKDVGEPPRSAPQRLVAGIQGLLDAVEVADLALDVPGTLPDGTPPRLDDGQRRLWQAHLREDVPLAGPAGQGAFRGRRFGRLFWAEWLILVGLILGMWLLGPAGPQTTHHAWPGIDGAYAAVEALPQGAPVLVDWAYDPATAGELDRAVYPVLAHLVDRGARLTVVSQLPGGMAMAQRVIRAVQEARLGPVQARAAAEQVTAGGFLPGGPAVLALLGQAPATGLPVDLEGVPARSKPALQALLKRGPALVLVVAAQAEDVQRWLEQAQPLNRAPVLAVTGAGADPVLRAYWDSGQLVGLVSGYDGGLAYSNRLEEPLPDSEMARLRGLLRGQQIGFWLLVGGLALALLFRRSSEV